MIKQYAILSVTLSAMLWCGTAISQEGVPIDSTNKTMIDSADKLGIIGLPYLSYSPETQLKLGVAGVISFHLDKRDVKHRRASTVSAGANITQLQQWLLAANFDFYFNEMHSRVNGRVGFERTPWRFYGVGPTTPDSNEVWYDPSYAKVGVSYVHQIAQTDDGQGATLGGRLEYWNTVMNSDTVGASELVSSQSGGSGGLSLGIGLVGTFDTRDNAYYPTRNWYVELRSMTYAKVFGADFDYNRSYLDVRTFTNVDISDVKLVFCGQTVIDVTVGHPPFYDLPTYGGDQYMRGILKGRYVDRASLVAQYEMRSHLFWKLGAAAFVSVGDVASELKHFALDHTKIAGGAGLRIYLDKEAGLIARVDVGTAGEKPFVYLSFGEAF